MGMVFCRGCGKELHDSAHTCPSCGAVQRPVLTQGRNRITAAVLAFFLGGFGAHKFYLGRIGWGIAYLLFFWTFIPAIVAFIEFIVYLCKSDEEFSAKYNRVPG